MPLDLLAGLKDAKPVMIIQLLLLITL